MSEPPAAYGAAAGHHLGQVIAPILYDARRHGLHHVPRSGPVVLVSNHAGFLDGPLVYCLAPRPVHFLVKRSYFSSAWGALLKGVGQIPIDQNTGDRAALSAARGVLARGGAVGVFPEGTRGSGQVRAVQQGAAWLALNADAPVVPVACLGTRGTGASRGSWPRPRAHLEVIFGEAFSVRPQEDVRGRERLRIATDTLRDRLALHVADAVSRTGMALPGDEPPRTT
ncbi:lysophospholipid acyltransferase family protein [Luteipulveratus sp. YIM 133132]|uniref:lysophospholipid acyltransferase family protein n=1 Tax=Luteipulveratus flavus TaxID=3031728 RepID=UPI0023AF21FF|nr:lysophospholipid acyltransferase family protein [Luteipulveratus sp. YIM 133132]MDE9367347.1 lysophospholipid acyltransferase family protein [Luteipulveratus sp. YIM 133132]